MQTLNARNLTYSYSKKTQPAISKVSLDIEFTYGFHVLLSSPNLFIPIVKLYHFGYLQHKSNKQDYQAAALTKKSFNFYLFVGSDGL